MQMILGVIADAANKAEGDKLNLLGVFHDLYAAELPCVHPQMALAMEFRAAPSDKGRSVRIRVPLFDPDGAQLFQLEINLQIAADHPALEPVVPFSFNLNNLSFAKEGSHRFEVFVDDELTGDIKLNVMRVAAPPAP